MAKEAPPSTPRESGNAIARHAATAGSISLVAIILFFAWLLFFQLPRHDAVVVQQASQQLAEQRAALVETVFESWSARLDALAANPAVIAALQSQDRNALREMERELARAFPGAASLRLIPLGKLGIAGLRDPDSFVRNNIEMDMLRQVSDGDIAAPEAYRDQERWLLSIAAPAGRAEAEYASGALLLSMPVSWLQTRFERTGVDTGAVEVATLYGDNSRVVLRTGTGDDAERAGSVDFADGKWRLRVYPGPAQIDHFSTPTALLWTAFAALTVAALLSILLTIRLLSASLARNLENLDATKVGEFSMPGFAQAQHNWLLRLKKALLSAAPGTAEAETTAAPDTRAAEKSGAAPTPEPPAPVELPERIFRAYDIRGLAEEELTDPVVETLGRAFGSEAVERGEQTVLVAADGRNSSPRIREALVRGLLASGRDVIDLGLVPTPVLYFATHQLGSGTGVMVTGSHNPAEYNGLKMVIANQTLFGDAVLGLKRRAEAGDFSSGSGEYRSDRVEERYIDYVINDVAVAQPLKIVIDAGNGATGDIAPRLFEALGCEVMQLHCDIDGHFPNHHPDPTIAANLQDLIAAVRGQEADIGIAFDGDGDRVGVVSGSGQIVAADRLLMLLAQDVVSRNPGADVLFDVKCTRHLNSLISSYGGRPIMWKSGHSFMKEKMAETGALLGGEYSGHIFFNERWFGFDDGMYAAARLVEILSTTDPDLDVHLQAFPETIGTPELKIESDDRRKFEIVEALSKQADFGAGKVSLLDGVRVDYQDGWGLVRASNTTPALTLRFEAESDQALARIQAQFRQQLAAVEPDLDFGF